MITASKDPPPMSGKSYSTPSYGQKARYVVTDNCRYVLAAVICNSLVMGQWADHINMWTEKACCNYQQAGYLQCDNQWTKWPADIGCEGGPLTIQAPEMSRVGANHLWLDGKLVIGT